MQKPDLSSNKAPSLEAPHQASAAVRLGSWGSSGSHLVLSLSLFLSVRLASSLLHIRVAVLTKGMIQAASRLEQVQTLPDTFHHASRAEIPPNPPAKTSEPPVCVALAQKEILG